MPFDVNAAIKEGYNPTEIADFLSQQKKFDAASARKEGYSDDEIIKHLNPAPKKHGLLETLKRSAESTASDFQTAIPGLVNPTEAAKKGLERDEAIREKYGEQESRLSKVEQAYKDKGLLSAIGTGLGEIPGAITEQAPNFAIGLGGARVGAMAVAPLAPMAGPAAPLVTAAGAGVGAFLPFFFQQYGGAIKKTAEIQKEKGQEIDVSGGRAAAFSAPAAGLDVLETFIPFGGKVAGKIFGPSVERLLARGMTKEAEEAAAKKLTQETFLPSIKNMDLGTVVKGTTKMAALEIPTEVTQQLLSRAQAKQDLFSKEALREYGETAFDVALLGPLGILGRVSDKSAARNTILKAQQEAAKTKQPVETSIEVAPLQLTYDPKVENGEVVNSSVYSTQKIIVHPDGSTSFPSESNNFRENPVDEFTDEGFEEKYTPQENKDAIELAKKEERRARREAKQAGMSLGLIYSGSEGQGGTDINEVSEENRKLGIVKQVAEEKQRIARNTVTKDLLKSWGIGHTANIYKDPDVMGKDITDPAQATIIKNKLLEWRDTRANDKVKKHIDEYLSRPEFSVENIGDLVLPTEEAATEVKPKEVTTQETKEEPSLFNQPIGSEFWSGIQNRDRSTDSSVKQMNGIANKPEYDRVSFSKSFTEGAPVVTGEEQIPAEQLGAKGVIVSSDGQKIPIQYAVIDANRVAASHDVNGSRNPNYTSEEYRGLRAITNGRVAGLQAGYARGTMGDYVTDLTHDDMHGINKDVIKGMENPMLVRVMPLELINKHMGDVSNTGSGMALNVIEQAKNDIRRININGLEFTEDGDISERTVIGFIRGMPEVEQNNLITKDGKPSKQAYDRLSAALFQGAYQNDKLTELAFQSNDDEVKNIVRALNMAAPNAIHLEGLEEYDVRPYVNEAVELAINARRNNIKLSDMVKQSDMTTSPISKDILNMFAENPRSARAMGENLNSLFDSAFDEATKEPDMFGEIDKRPIHELIQDSFTKKVEEDLFATPSEAPKEVIEELPKLSEDGLTISKGRHPQVVAAARERLAGRMSRAEYEKYVEKYMPFSKVPNPSGPAENEKVREALDKNQKKLFNAPVADGTKVGLRMDIKALKRGASVVTVHPENNVNTTLSYRSVGHIKNVTFNSRNQKTLLKVAAGETSKFPQQTAEGSWVNTSPEEVYSKVKSLLNDKAWTQVGVDPLRHSYFYDRETGQPLKSASEVLQVGRFMLAKDVKFDNKENFLYQKDTSTSLGSKEEIAIQKQLNGKTMREVAQWTVDNAPNKFAKAIANMVNRRLNEMEKRGIKLNFAIEGGDSRPPDLFGARGLTHSIIYQTGMGQTEFTVSLNGVAVVKNQRGFPSGVNYKTILHELLHVATSGQLILRNPRDPLVVELNNLLGLVVKDFKAREKAGNLSPFLQRIANGEINTLESMDELLAWGLTDRETQEYLSEIKVGDKTLFNKLIDLVRQVLGISKEYETALDRLVRTSESILNEDIKTVANMLEVRGYSFGTTPSQGGIGIQQTLFEKSKQATSKFKQWFGDSKVVDKKGEPRVMYHGTANDIEEFLPNSFFAYDPKGASGYAEHRGIENDEDYNPSFDENDGDFPVARGANVIPVYIKASKIADYDDVMRAAKKVKVYDEEMLDSFMYTSPNNGEFEEYAASKVIPELKRQGFDAVHHYDYDMGGMPMESLQVFDPANIKSATGNNGEYNPALTQINYEMNLSGVDPKVARLAEETFGKQEPKTYVETIKDLTNKYRARFKYMVADSFADIANVSKQGYMKARLSKTIDTQMQVLLDYGHLVVRGGTLGYKSGTKGLKEIYAPLGNEVERFQVWVALNRDANLPQEKRSFKDDLVNKRNEFIKGDLNGVPRAKLYEQARKEQQELNNSVLDVAKELGLIDDEAYLRFKNDAYYIPFYKEMENGDIEGARIASKLTGQKFSHTLKGGEKKVNDLMDNMLRNWSHIISAALKNDAAVTTIKDAVKLKIAVPVKPHQKGNPDVVKVMEDGMPAYYKIADQHLIDNIAMINYVGKQSALFKAMTKPSAWLRYGVTLSPGYKIRNLIKDTVTTIAVSDANPNAITTFKKGWELTNKANDQYADALAAGAIFQLGSSHDGKSSDLIKRLIAEGVPGNNILNTQEKMTGALSKIFKSYQALGDRLENVNRMALFDKLIKEGKSPLEAAYESRDLLDFTSQGASRSLQVLSQLVPFMNTRVQGLYKLYRTSTDAEKQQRLFYTLGAIAFASGALYMMNKDDEDFKKRQDWDRDNFWWFKIDGVAYRIPKPYEIGGIGTLVERGLEQFVDDSVESKVFFKRIGQYFLDTLSLDPTPQAIKPMWNVLNNKDSFTSAPIETPGMERYTKTERYGDKTSSAAKLLSKGINVPLSAVGLENNGPSPVQIDYLAQGYFGWLGGLLGSTAARALEDKPTKPLLDATGLAQTEPETNSKYITDFYQSNAKIQNHFADLKRYAEQNDNEKVAEILKEKGNLIGLQQLYSQTVNQLAQQRKYIQMISEQHDLSRDEREKMIVAQKIIMSKMAENVENIRKSFK